MTPPLSLNKYFHALRYLPAAQVGYLLRHRIKGFYRQWFPSRTAQSIGCRVEKEFPLNSIRKADPERSRAICFFPGTPGTQETYERFLAGSVRILNGDHPFDKRDFWSLADSDSLSPLEVERLHYHGFLVDFSRLIE